MEVKYALVFSVLAMHLLLSVDGQSLSAVPPFQTAFVSMRDGIKLAVDFVDTKTERYPVILELTPYGRGPRGVNYRYEAPYWFENGYLFVIADCRGTGDSEGDLAFFTREGEDGYDLIEWIAKQPWSNGRVGMRGSSYTGTNQWYIAREQSPHLFCITPSASMGHAMQDLPYRNGAFGVGWAISWILDVVKTSNVSIQGFHPDPTSWLNHRPLYTLDEYVIGKILPLYRTFLDHPFYDSYWHSIDFTPDDFARITIPSLAFTGWFDGTMPGTIWRFQGVRQYAPHREDQFLIIGPYTHEDAPDGGYDYHTGKPVKKVGDIPIADNALLPGLNMTHEFFDWCLKNGSRPDWKPAQIYVTGSDRWITRDVFPPPEAYEKSFYLNSGGHANTIEGDGRLQWDLPNVTVTDSYSYDPRHPVSSAMHGKSTVLPVDFNSYLNQQDILVYTSEPLNTSLTVIGDITVELTISSTVSDTDFVVELMDVMTDGRSIKMGSKSAGQLRTRYREGYDHEVFMSPNQTYLIRIELHAIGHTFLPGHRIRLAVTSSFFPWISANPNTGAPIASDIQSPIVAQQSIYHGQNQVSRIRMMVVDDPSSGETR